MKWKDGECVGAKVSEGRYYFIYYIFCREFATERCAPVEVLIPEALICILRGTWDAHVAFSEDAP